MAGIRDIEVDEPANAVSATVIGEKIKIISSSGIMNMRMVGKGAAKQLAAQIRNAQNEPGVCVNRPGSRVDNRPKKKGRAKNKIILGVAVFTLLVAVWIAKMVLVDGGTLQIGGLLIDPHVPPQLAGLQHLEKAVQNLGWRGQHVGAENSRPANAVPENQQSSDSQDRSR